MADFDQVMEDLIVRFMFQNYYFAGEFDPKDDQSIAREFKAMTNAHWFYQDFISYHEGKDATPE